MSLRIFHICFITIATLLCAGVAWFCYEQNAKLWAALFGTVALILPPYGAWFLRKTRKFVY